MEKQETLLYRKNTLKDARKGIKVLRNILKKIPPDIARISAHKTAILLFPAHDDEVNSLGVKYIDNYAFSFRKDAVVIITSDKKVFEEATQKIYCENFLFLLSQKDIDDIIAAYSFLPLDNRIKIISLERPLGRCGEKLLSYKPMTKELLVKIGVYQIFPHKIGSGGKNDSMIKNQIRKKLIQFPLLLNLYYCLFLKPGKRIFQKIKKQFPNKFLMVCPYSGTGDVYLACSLIDEYAKKHDISEYAIAVIGGSNNKIAKMFGVKNIAVFSGNEMNLLVRYIYAVGMDESDVLIAEPSPKYMERFWIADYLRNFEKLNFIDMYRCGIFVLPDAIPQKPEFADKSETVAILIKKHNLPRGKTILLAPFINTMDNLPNRFWIELAENLKQLGYCVCTNCGSEKEKEIEGTIRIKLPYSELKPFLEYAGIFIGLRSGLCEVVSSIECRKILIYQNYRWGNAYCMDYFSMKVMGLDKNAFEIESQAEYKDLIKRILTILD